MENEFNIHSEHIVTQKMYPVIPFDIQKYTAFGVFLLFNRSKQ